MPEAASGEAPLRWVAGVDGCRAGWLVWLRPLGDPSVAEVRLVHDFKAVLALDPAPEVIAVDIPIGLPERGGPGGRACDVAARANLGGRQSSVFAVPARAAVRCDDYGDACAAALGASDPPRKVSKQTYNLFPKIREVDDLMTPVLQSRVREVHPEVAFWAMNGETPLCEPKKVKSRPYPPGLALRRSLLAAEGYDPERIDPSPFPFRTLEAGADDLLDAAACAWTAVRIALGMARRFPASPPDDGRGLRMEIWG